jgi:hypothetical protein
VTLCFHGQAVHADYRRLSAITLPDGRRLVIAVFVTDAKADEPTREKVIARIAKAAYDVALASR